MPKLGRSRRILLALVLGGCGRPNQVEAPAQDAEPPPPGVGADAAEVEAEVAEPEGQASSASDKCDPLPREGTPCDGSVGYCVVSWGEPGGHSTALWCRDGRWEIEEEVNLPEEPGGLDSP